MVQLNLASEFPEIDYGPNGRAFRTLVERMRDLTVGEIDVMAEVHSRWVAGDRADWGRIIRTTRSAEPRAALRIARDIAPGFLPWGAQAALREAALATLARDRIPANVYELEMRALRRAVDSLAGRIRDPRPADFEDWAETKPPMRRIRTLVVFRLKVVPLLVGYGIDDDGHPVAFSQNVSDMASIPYELRRAPTVTVTVMDEDVISSEGVYWHTVDGAFRADLEALLSEALAARRPAYLQLMRNEAWQREVDEEVSRQREARFW